MNICNTCKIPMVNAMSFSERKCEKYCMCPKCKNETKHILFNDDELDFKGVLYVKKYKNSTKKKLTG